MILVSLAPAVRLNILVMCASRGELPPGGSSPRDAHTARGRDIARLRRRVLSLPMGTPAVSLGRLSLPLRPVPAVGAVVGRIPRSPVAMVRPVALAASGGILASGPHLRRIYSVPRSEVRLLPLRGFAPLEGTPLRGTLPSLNPRGCGCIPRVPPVDRLRVHSSLSGVPPLGAMSLSQV